MPRALNRDSRQGLAFLARLAEVPTDVFLPGHGDPSSDGAAEAVGAHGTRGRRRPHLGRGVRCCTGSFAPPYSELKYAPPNHVAVEEGQTLRRG